MYTWSVRTLGLTKAFQGRPALQGLNLAIQPGEQVLIQGVPGAGKSTLLRLLATAARPDAGSFYLAGHRITSWSGHRQPLVAVRQAAGYLPDETGLMDELTGWEHGLLWARLHGLPYREARLRLRLLLDWAGLATLQGRAVRTYRYPERRRLGLIRALLHRPSVLLLEDPGRGQPPDFRERVSALLQRHSAAGGTVLLAVDLPEGVQLSGPERLACTRRITLDRGQVVRDSQTEEAC